MEGPYFSPKQAGAQDPAIITPPKAEDYNYLLGKYPSVIKRWSFAPELEGTEQFMDALNNAGVVASVAHTDALYSDVETVHNKGCKLITHFYSCTSTITRDKGFRRLGVIEAGYLMDDMAVEVIADGCHIPKELFSLIHKIKGEDNICLVTDAIQLAGSDNEFATVGGVPCKVKDGVAEAVEAEKERLRNGTFDVFYGPITDADGIPRVEAGASMTDDAMLNEFDWYVEGVIIDEE